MRVLFVDDDVNVLFALRRTMHGMRNEWDMEFVSSAAQALQRLATNPADVIVSDMRMPGMDGWELLSEVKELYPQTVRLVLSGYAEPGAIMRLVGIAHQYISKPGDSAALKAAIAQTMLMRELLHDQDLVLRAGQISNLPSLPTAFQEISSCLRRSNATVADAARIIGHDVAMTANIMKLVNSAFFGARRQVSNVERAVAYLGLDTLTALVLGHGLFQGAGSTGMEVLWQHSLKTALAARAIALSIEEAFLAGMLHDVGHLIVGARSEPSAKECKAVDSAEFSKRDKSVAPDDQHVRAGAYLLALWGFPSQIVAAVALHDMPSRRADRNLDLTVLVHIADRLAHAADDGFITPEQLGVELQVWDEFSLGDRMARWRGSIQGLSGEEHSSRPSGKR
jgi:HD-like signal output (HDOD) protein/CheY-like chemotaxis protein